MWPGIKNQFNKRKTQSNHSIVLHSSCQHVITRGYLHPDPSSPSWSDRLRLGVPVNVGSGSAESGLEQENAVHVNFSNI